MLSKSTDILTKRPSSLDELSTSIHLLQDVQENGDTIVARFEPLEEMYQLLTKYEVQISENETADLAQLRGSWSEFSQMLVGAEKMLQSSKKGMKMDLETSVDDFMQLVGDTRKSSLLKLCYNDDFSIPDAQKILAEWKSRVEGLRAKEESLKPGMSIFGIEPPRYKGLEEIERDMGLLERVEIAASWDAKWNEERRTFFGTRHACDGARGRSAQQEDCQARGD